MYISLSLYIYIYIYIYVYLRSPCPGIIRLAGRTAGKSPSSQSEAATGPLLLDPYWTPAAEGC